MNLGKSIIILFLIAIFIAILISIFTPEKEAVVPVFPESIIVGTTSSYPDVNLISKTLANKVLKMDTIQLMIVDVPPKLQGEYEAYVVPGPVPHSYVIFLSPLVKRSVDLMRVLSHEFAHIKQYESKRLIPVNIQTGLYVWEGDTINFARIPYEKRGFEIEAFRIEKELKSELYSILYP